MGRDSLLIVTVKRNTNMKNFLVVLFSVILIISLIFPETDAWGARGRAAVALASNSKGGNKKAGASKARKVRRLNKKRGGKTWDAAPSDDTDVVYDDYEPAASEDSAVVEAAGTAGDLAGVCEVLMFDRGEGTYSLKFIQNKC